MVSYGVQVARTGRSVLWLAGVVVAGWPGSGSGVYMVSSKNGKEKPRKWADKGQMENRWEKVGNVQQITGAYKVAPIRCLEDGVLESVSRAKEWLISVFSWV